MLSYRSGDISVSVAYNITLKDFTDVRARQRMGGCAVRSCLWDTAVLLGRVALGAQRPIVIKLSRVRSVGRSVCLSVQCIVEKRQIAAGSRSAP